MNSNLFFHKVNTYAKLSEASRENWQKLLREEFYKKGQNLVNLGQIPTKVAFVLQGLFCQSYVSESGDTTIKYFFPEGRFAASVGAMLTSRPSAFSVTALEDTGV